MNSYLSLLVIIVASVLLIKAVEIFIESTSKIASRFGISEYTISFLMVGLGTSLPEVLVGISSAIQKEPILSFGNALGSNLALLTLIVSLPILFVSQISTRSILHTKDAYFSVLFSLLPLALAVDGVLTRSDGVFLLFSYAFYSAIVVKRSHGIERFMQKIEDVNLGKEITFSIGSLLLLLASSQAIVMSAEFLSSNLGWSLGFIGLTLTAVGTSLPEIAYAIGATKRGHQGGILGDIVGSVVANSTAVLGITAVIFPIEAAKNNTNVSSMFFLIFALLVFLRFSRTRERLDKSEAFVLLALYILFVTVEYYAQFH